jgi:hypothetical protein
VCYWVKWRLHMVSEMCISSAPRRMRSVLTLNNVAEVSRKEEHSITFINWVHESLCIKECGVYSETQFDILDIIAPLLYTSNFLCNLQNDLCKILCSVLKNGKIMWYYKCVYFCNRHQCRVFLSNFWMFHVWVG